MVTLGICKLQSDNEYCSTPPNGITHNTAESTVNNGYRASNSGDFGGPLCDNNIRGGDNGADAPAPCELRYV
jgi:hypothetical protein